MTSPTSSPRPPDALHDGPLTRRVLQVCEQTGNFIEWWGFRSILGRVWTLLALRGEAMSQVEIAELLGVSKALVHGAISDLEARGLVRRVDDSRRAPWVAVIDVWPTITEVLRAREWMLIEQVRVALDAAIEEASIVKRKTGQEPFSIERLRLLASLTESAQNFLRMVLSLRVANESRGVRDLLRMATTVIQGLRTMNLSE